MRKVYYTIGVLLLTIFLYQIVGTQIDNLKKLKFIDSIPKEKKYLFINIFFLTNIKRYYKEKMINFSCNTN